MTSVNDSDANMADEKRARSETNGGDKDTEVPPPLQVVGPSRFEQWRANYIDDPRYPPIEVVKLSNSVIATREILTPFQTEAVLCATFEKYGPIEQVNMRHYGKVLRRGWIKFVHEDDAHFAWRCEWWRLFLQHNVDEAMAEAREREALLAPSD
jgi:hypothetical protein